MTSYFGTAVPDPGDPNFWRQLNETAEQRADRMHEEWMDKRHAYAFSRDFQEAILKALGLEGRKIRRLVLTMEVNKPVTLQIDSYATFPDGQPYILADLLQLASFEQPQPETTPTPEKETN